MKPCTWESEDPADAFVCTRCGHSTPRADIRVLPYRRACGVQPARGFGDVLAKLLKPFIKQKPGCGCPKRQAVLNRLFPFDVSAWKTRLLWPLWWMKARFPGERR